jgi:predicted metal-dependent enzyme (double-stranded beta helix superfamily)
LARLTYDLAAFTQDLDALVEDARAHPRAIVQTAKPLLERLIADMSWLPPPMAVPAEKGSVQYLLHRHPASAYTVVSVVFPVGYSTTVHDHGVWGLVAVWQGEEQEERFRRTDDGPRPGYAELAAVGAGRNTPGCVTWLLPPDEEIHRIRNLASVPACSIHVYGGDLNGKLRHQYDLETGEIKEFRTAVVALE